MIPFADNEAQRLQTLYGLEILDTPSELEFDKITELAAKICNCPSSLITFVDQDRQWFKSAYNFTLKETPREESLCAFTILKKKALIIDDLFKNIEFKNHPAAAGPAPIRFYAGIPISVKGYNLGAICVFDYQPHSLSSFQIESLESLGILVNKILLSHQSTREAKNLKQQVHENEKQLAYAAQLAEMAEITGGVAHEINSPLAVIRLSMDFIESALLSGTQLDPKLTEKVSKISKAIDRIHNITHSLKTYSRDSRHDSLTMVRLKDIIDDTLPFCRERLKKANVLFEVEFFDPTIDLLCRPVEISQVLLNLINNASDAIQDKNDRWIRLEVTKSQHALEIAVIDSGSGIAAELQDQIFEPFFTTKKWDLGTGLGLGICRRIAEFHGGTITIDAKSPNTKFSFQLPLKTAA